MDVASYQYAFVEIYWILPDKLATISSNKWRLLANLINYNSYFSQDIYSFSSVYIGLQVASYFSWQWDCGL